MTAPILAELDTITLDWSDLVRVSDKLFALLERIGSDQAALDALLEHMQNSPALLAQCESHKLLDRLVLYDALDRGFRMQLNFFTAAEVEWPHNHRFSFGTRVLRGGYLHTRHRITGEPVEAAVYADELGKALSTTCDVETLSVENVGARSMYVMSHGDVHSTIVEPRTVSLFIRGPAELKTSLFTDRAGRVWWRSGRADETRERRERKRMRDDVLRRLCGDARRLTE